MEEETQKQLIDDHFLFKVRFKLWIENIQIINDSKKKKKIESILDFLNWND